MCRRNEMMKKIYLRPITSAIHVDVENPFAESIGFDNNNEQANGDALAKPVTFDPDGMEDYTLVPYDSWDGYNWDEEIEIRNYIE